jgi:hypothetical protein
MAAAVSSNSIPAPASSDPCSRCDPRVGSAGIIWKYREYSSHEKIHVVVAAATNRSPHTRNPEWYRVIVS